MTATNKGGRYPAEALTRDEIDRLLAGCSRRAPTGIRNRALILFCARSGLRISEALAIRVSDVNLAKHSIRLLDTKTGEAQTRGYHPSADDSLARWLDTRKSLGIGSRGKLFCTLDGGPMSAEYVRQLLRRLALKADLDKRVTPHTLRHSYAMALNDAKTPVTVISKLLGHSSIAVTARYLDHLSNSEAIDALQDVELPPLGES